MRVACATALLLALLAPAAAGAATRAECRAACGNAIEGCIAWRGAALRDVEAPPRVVRRKAKGIRRGCTKAAIRQCRSDGAAVCDTPVFCACGK